MTQLKTCDWVRHENCTSRTGNLCCFPIRDTIAPSRRPVTTMAIIALTVAIFVVEFVAHPQHLGQIMYLFGIVPARYVHLDWALRVGFPVDSYFPFLTSIFLHSGLIHVASNTWILWIFGDNVEDRMGRGRFAVFYIVCGIIAGLVHLWANPHSTVPAVGASGAIAGVLGAYLIPVSKGSN